MRFEVHKETLLQPSPPPQGEGLATNMEGPSYASKWLCCKGMWGKDKELLRHKDKKLHHQQKLGPTPSHTRGDEREVGDSNNKRDKRSPHSHGE